MSNFIRDVEARSRDIPLNGLPTLFSVFDYGNDGRSDPSNPEINNGHELTLKSFMSNSEPVQEVDTYYSNVYKTRVDTLRTKTESWYDYLNASRVPFYIEDPVIVRIRDNSVTEESGMIPADSFIIEDHKEPVRITGKNRLIYKLNFDPFIEDQKNRIHSYNGTIKIASSNHEDNGVMVNDTTWYLALKYGFNAADAIERSKLNYTWNVERGDNPITNSTPLELGTIIDTGLPATQKVSYEKNLIKPFLFFINGYAIKWSRVSFAGDRNDLYVILDLTGNSVLEAQMEDPHITCIGIPFSVRYVEHTGEWTSDLSGRTELFKWLDDNGTTAGNCQLRAANPTTSHNPNYIHIFPTFDRYYIKDISIERDKLAKSHTSINKLFYNYILTDGDLDYTNKVKNCNVFPFKTIETTSTYYNGPLMERNNTVYTKWTPFNHLNVKVENDIIEQLEEDSSMRFRIVLDKDIRYDQDNILRMWNKIRIESDYETYVASLDANIELFIQKLYELAQNPDLEIKFYQAHFDNMEEGSTPVDEFIYYTKQSTAQVLHNLAEEMFADDRQEVKDCISGIIDDAYILVPANEYAFDEWSLRKNLPEMFIYGDNIDLIINNMDLLTKVFDFRYTDHDPYFKNLNIGTDYIVGYDPDKLESSIIRPTYSITVDSLYLLSKVRSMEIEGEEEPYWYIDFPQPYSDLRKSYLMLFKNGLLYHKYHTIEYLSSQTVRFNMIPNQDIMNDGSIWELVWFTNVVNEPVVTTFTGISERGFATRYDSLGNIIKISSGHCFIPSNTSIVDPENLTLFLNRIEDNPYQARIEEMDPTLQGTRYPIFYRIKSYEQHQVSTGNNTQKTIYDYTSDPQINGVHRITKQGGGEYFILPMIKSGSFHDMPNGLEQANPDRNIFSTDVGLGSHAFAFCSNISAIHFNGTTSQWRNVATDSSWTHGIDVDSINDNNGGINCTDGDVTITEREW